MKEVLISIKPRWCELIASEKKTVEVRKTKPKLETPFKVFIYATKQKHYYKISDHLLTSDENLYLSEGKIEMSDCFKFWNSDVAYQLLNRKIIGEFVCDRIYQYSTLQNTNGVDITDDEMTAASGLSKEQIHDYESSSEARENCIYKIGVYGWHISDLVIYDKPKELSEFSKCGFGHPVPLKRPPQSWMYVEVEE